MKTYDSLDELWLDALEEALARPAIPSRDGECHETLGFVGRLANPLACFIFNPERRLSPSYAAAELIWYLSGQASIEMIKEYAPQYERFANDGVAHGAYGRRLFGSGDEAYASFAEQVCMDAKHELHEAVVGKRCASQWYTLLQVLKKSSGTRQAVISLWSPSDLLYSFAGTKNDIPCTLSLQFLIRDGRLCLITTMRSNDLWLGTPYDVFCFCHLQMIVSETLQVPIGWYQHQAGSLHVYGRNLEKAKRCLSVGILTQPLVYTDYPQSVQHLHEKVDALVSTERHNRRLRVLSANSEIGGPSTLWTQLLVMAASKWDADAAEKHLSTPCMRKHLQCLLAKKF